MKKELQQSEMIDVFIKLKSTYDQLSKSQKKIAQYILHHYEKAHSMAAVEIAKEVGVSEATVVRFSNALGFEGYPEFRKKLQEDVNSKLTTLARIKLSQEADAENAAENKYARKVLKKDIAAIADTMATLNDPAFEESAKAIAAAKKVFIIGFRTTGMLVEYLGYYLNLILDDVRIINHSNLDFYEHLIKATSEDVVIAISLPRYAQRTIEAAAFLQGRGPKLIAITDNENAPLCQYADYVLPVKSRVYSFVDSLVAPMSLINALVIAVGNQNLDKTKASFEEMEKIWQQQETYAGDRVEGINS